MDTSEFLKAKTARTDRALDEVLAARPHIPGSLREAMRYSLFAGGKRLRPALALGAAELAGGDDTPAVPMACALEMVHTYSLIHDDLPAMDDSDLRRGKPALHKVVGDGQAVLAGDALLTLAFEVAAETGNAEVMRELARAAGPEGMVAGQVLDLESEGKRIGLDALRQLHARKTGALIRAAVRCGAILGGAAESRLQALTVYGEQVGLAFQIADDILDVVGDQEHMGKPVRSDAESEKSTYPAIVGLDRARELGNQAVAEALEALAAFGGEADTFRALARFIVDRDT